MLKVSDALRIVEQMYSVHDEERVGQGDSMDHAISKTCLGTKQ